MLRITRDTDYAARMLLHLACLGDDAQVSIRVIAAQRHLPVPFVRRLVARLVEAGLLATTRGASGGIRLARPAHNMSLADVVTAMEGPLALNDCVGDARACPLSRRCPVNGAWSEATRALEQTLANVRFDALANASASHVPAHLSAHATGTIRTKTKTGTKKK